MYLLYLDGSGSVKNPNERHFILAGIAVFERQVFHLIKRTDQYIGDLAVAPDDPVEYAFEEVCNRFDLFLRRLHFRDSDTNRGLVVMDKSHYEDVLQGLAAKYREHGTRWGDLRNMAEVPLFVDSAASRLIQLADLLAWAVWRYYEHADTRYFNRSFAVSTPKEASFTGCSTALSTQPTATARRACLATCAMLCTPAPRDPRHSGSGAVGTRRTPCRMPASARLGSARSTPAPTSRGRAPGRSRTCRSPWSARAPRPPRGRPRSGAAAAARCRRWRRRPACSAPTP